MGEAGNKSKKGIIIAIICVLVVVAAVGVYFVISNLNERNAQSEAQRQETDRQEQVRAQIVSSGEIHEGITINGVDVGGLNAEDAKAKLNKELRSDAEIKLAG